MGCAASTPIDDSPRGGNPRLTARAGAVAPMPDFTVLDPAAPDAPEVNSVERARLLQRRRERCLAGLPISPAGSERSHSRENPLAEPTGGRRSPPAASYTPPSDAAGKLTPAFPPRSVTPATSINTPPIEGICGIQHVLSDPPVDVSIREAEESGVAATSGGSAASSVYSTVSSHISASLPGSHSSILLPPTSGSVGNDGPFAGADRPSPVPARRRPTFPTSFGGGEAAIARHA